MIRKSYENFRTGICFLTWYCHRCNNWFSSSTIGWNWQQSAVLFCRALNRTSKTEHQFTDYMETDFSRFKKYAVSSMRFEKYATLVELRWQSIASSWIICLFKMKHFLKRPFRKMLFKNYATLVKLKLQPNASSWKIFIFKKMHF